jgi:hypothetical protein
MRALVSREMLQSLPVCKSTMGSTIAVLHFMLCSKAHTMTKFLVPSQEYNTQAGDARCPSQTYRSVLGRRTTKKAAEPEGPAAFTGSFLILR